MKAVGLARLGRDAEVRYTQNGTAVANLALAFNYGRKDDSGQQPTQWLQASLWGKRAEALAPYLTKGTAIVAHMGDVHIEQFQKQDGTQGVAMKALVDDIELVPGQRQEGQKQAQEQRRRQAPHSAPQAQNQGAGDLGLDDDLNDDIPF